MVTLQNSTLLKFEYCYHKCMKKFIGYSKHSSVTDMLLVLGLPSFNTVIHNYRCSYMWNHHCNELVKSLRSVCSQCVCLILAFLLFSIFCVAFHFFYIPLAC